MHENVSSMSSTLTTQINRHFQTCLFTEMETLDKEGDDTAIHYDALKCEPTKAVMEFLRSFSNLLNLLNGDELLQ